MRPDYKKWELMRAYALRDGGWHKVLRPKNRNVDGWGLKVSYETLAALNDGGLLIALRPDYKKWEPLRERWLSAQSFAAKL